MSKDKALKLALEALEPVSTFGRVGSRDVDTAKAQEAIAALREALAEQPAPVQGWKLVPVHPTQEMLDAPINAYPADALVTWKAMLAAAPQPAQIESLADIGAAYEDIYADQKAELAKALAEQPAQQEQQPVWRTGGGIPRFKQPAQQEPVAAQSVMTVRIWRDKNSDQNAEFKNWHKLPDGEHILYTSPPAQRTWVGLTDEDVKKLIPPWDCWTYEVGHEEAATFARTIETKLKEKNT